MKQNLPAIFLCATLALSGCIATNPSSQFTRIDEVPMYGGMDRSSNPTLKTADEEFIAGVTEAFGSREKAARAWVEVGFEFSRQNNLGMAMRRFNQAWLLEPNNAEVFAGFGSVLARQGKACEAKDMVERALTLNPPTFQGIYPDAANIVARCAITDATLSPQAKSDLFARSEALYKKAEEVEPNKQYVYGSWATTYYRREQYAEAWSMVAKQRTASGNPNPQLLKDLSEKMTEPLMR